MIHRLNARGRVTRPFVLRGPLAPLVSLLAVVAVVAAAMFALVIAMLALPRLRHAFAKRGSDGPDRMPPGAAAKMSEPVPDAIRRERSFAEVVEVWPVAILTALSLSITGLAAPAQAKILVPMDDKQTDHLKAYGLTFWVLTHGQKCEWLLNYRGGSFLLPEDAAIAREANIRGVTTEPMGGAAEASMRAEIVDNNMEAITLEKAPKIAVYIPPNTPPWDDAVTLALHYAEIPYTTVWDEQVLKGELSKCDWLHLHHEDFTAQHGKFYAAYHTFPWYQEEERVQRAMATKMGFEKVPQEKGAVALAIKDFIAKGGFMFGMCSATDTYDIALASLGIDITDGVYDGDGPDPNAQRKLDYGRTLAFKDFRLEMDPYVYRFSDIDVTQEAALRGPNAVFTLFDFSAKNDPVPSMLVQDHVNAVPEFLGQSTGFHKGRIKSGVLSLGEVEGTDEVKYLHGQFGRGTFTFLGGHDPEDYQHMVGDPPTELSRFKHSPGYRLILNNVLFPAAEKKKQRT